MSDRRYRAAPAATVVLAAAWLAAVLGSFIAFFMTEPTGDGFVRGFNRITAFLQWQGAAFFLGLISACIFRAFGDRRENRLWWLSHAPFLVSSALWLLLILGFIAIVAWARFQG